MGRTEIGILSQLLIISTFLVSVSKGQEAILPFKKYQTLLPIRHSSIPIESYRSQRSGVISTNPIANGGLYSIRNVGDELHLTAKSGRTKPGPVVVKKWQDTPAQLWEVNKLETSRGYSLKPLHNEFNSITSQLTSNTHSYHSWEFKLKEDGTWVIHNVLENRCIKSNGNGEIVSNAVCDPRSPSQLWELRKID